MRFRVLGSVTAAPQTPTAPKVRSVLAVLLTRTNQPVSALTLTDELWGDTPPRTAVSALQVYISQLRRVLKEDGRRLLSTDLSGYRLHIAPDDLDLTVFEALSHEGCRAVERGEYGFGAEVLRSALDLWCGPALSGVGHGPVLARAAECELIVLLRATTARALLAGGRIRAAVAERITDRGGALPAIVVVPVPLHAAVGAEALLLVAARRAAETIRDAPGAILTVPLHESLH